MIVISKDKRFIGDFEFFKMASHGSEYIIYGVTELSESGGHYNLYQTSSLKKAEMIFEFIIKNYIEKVDNMDMADIIVLAEVID